jgi:uncharacterized membrane protein/mono/diheme cytochrome c family protein
MSLLLTITEFIGRFHPVLVHLPIGILLLSVLFHLLSYKKGYESLQPAVKVALLTGTVAAIVSCISGWMLSSSGEYEEGLVNTHQWLGIGLAIVSVLACFLINKHSVIVKWLMPLIGLLIIITGHLGGSLTHGEDYLTQGLSSGTDNKTAAKPIANAQQAVVYTDIVQPILQSKCYSCHGPAKQKGQLRLDEPPFIDKGGEEGKVLIAGNAGESEMIRRMLLPLDNKDHMPPKQRSQPTKAEIELLSWWVASGADYHKKTAELDQPEKIKPYLISLQTGNTASNDIGLSAVPDEKVDKAPDEAIMKLRDLNVAVNPVSQNSNYLTISFVAVDSVTAQHTQLLQQLGKQVAWLKLGNTKINDSVMRVVGKLSSLTKLFLNNSNVTDRSLVHLNTLSKLQYLNLSSTAVTVTGINSLTNLKSLRQLYVYKTGAGADLLGNLKKHFPSALIDTGGYAVQFLPTDTMIVKEKPKKG